MQYKTLTANEQTDMMSIHSEIDWPDFIINDSVNTKYWEKIYEIFPAYQLSIMDGNSFVGSINSIPIAINLDELNLDDRGWDWALEKGFEDLNENNTPAALCGLQIGIAKQYAGKGLSPFFINTMKDIALHFGYKALVLPIRPTWKSRYPLIDMADYIEWKTDKNEPYDPWIRMHTRLGAKILSVCKKSMLSEAPINQWEKWTGLSFQTSGKYIISHALNPVDADIKNKLITYTEANVWMIHFL